MALYAILHILQLLVFIQVQMRNKNFVICLQALDIEEELDLEGRPSRFNSTIIQPNLQNGEQSNSSGAEKEEFTRKKSQKWRKTGVQSLNTDFRDTF